MQSPVVSNDINVLSSTRENHYFDRKSARIKPHDLARTVIAFANASGGKLVVGIEDGGKITGFGCQKAQPIEAFEQCHITECSPSPDVSYLRMRETRYSRNPRIARTLIEFEWVRELNEGVKRIYTEMQAMLLSDPVFSEPDRSMVQLTLENNIGSRMLRQRDAIEVRLSKDVLDGLSEYELIAVQAAYANGSVTTKGLAELIGRSTRSASSVLKALADKGVLSWHGTARNDPAQYYSLA